MENYKPNSNKIKSEQKETQEKKIEKVVQGTVKTKKKNELSKFKEAFISEDARNVKTYILTDVIIPAHSLHSPDSHRSTEFRPCT